MQTVQTIPNVNERSRLARQNSSALSALHVSRCVVKEKCADKRCLHLSALSALSAL